ncbi:MAG: hypothetical protein A2W61_05140 [Deltaproteobacteria bacterium RIFCSPLOWO2_01_44_7]|nr:MAG: hypothetical protein A2712_09280 [Deltaproteobacteria bacterium RIFCSPHIGHO2_01_FULL_43_49]OGQ14475.1 MAG: hypothetical protein A3D22_09705 [Deltaproteobacteria bacterium RIFCSPHIGHO2_02_FULL_44_53]OGQ27856.1 MAG: hypothetical protein A3D98_04105 [Deltaproteobacteria bacterium RIFCSPHIGHO2_12_FULL_44_21]OGQ30932.1 MAG: hypothetical protein A2979_01780 [Deltaproteobacteria bacterium RIFCSPLOWO2_01_FULL_45_74]OGQ38967.1 MAG: hypothetical protein A2W61_05140 [Deltaproteobacteria bacterium 
MPETQKESKAVRRKYNVIARVYDHIFSNYTRKTIGAALGGIQLKGQESLLDIGCGTGSLEKILVQQHPQLKIIGIDLSEDMLELGRKKLKGSSNVIFKQGNFLNVDLPQNTFDAAFSLSNLHYFSKPEATFQKAASLLKKSGHLIIVDWNRDFWQGKLYNWYMNWADPAFAKVFNPSEAKTLLAQCGFEIEKIHLFGVGLRWRMMCLVARKL